MKLTVFNPKQGFVQETSLVPSINKPPSFLIGRHPNCDLILNTPEVSRVHALITYCQQHHYFTELASTYGSRLNNQEIFINENRILIPGDIIQISDFCLLFLPESEKIEKSNPYWFLKPQTTDNSTQTASGKQEELIVKCSQIIEETHDVITYRLVTSQPTKFDYKPGQFITLDLEIDGNSIKRSYSISSTPSRPHNLAITVKRVPTPTDTPDAPPGLVSNWLYDNLKVGDKLKISPPMGDFNYFENSYKKLLFICSDIGITPLMSMSRWLCDTNADLSVILIYSIPTQQDIIFQEELELMALRYPNFKLAINLTSKEFDLAWSGYTGRLSKTMLSEIAPDFRERAAYVCGSEGFLESVQTVLKELNFPMNKYHQESFGLSSGIKPAFTSPITDTSQKGVVVFSNSKREVVCYADETILEAAQREAIDLPYGCQMGVCGRCKLRKFSGSISYDNDFECEDDYVLTCVAKVNETVTIEG